MSDSRKGRSETPAKSEFVPGQCARIDRRSVLTSLAVVATGATLGVKPAFAQQTAPENMPPQVGDYLVARLGKTPLTPDDIHPDSPPYHAFAMSPDNVIRSADFNNELQLYRYDPKTLDPAVAALAGDGVLGFTVICTHAGCVLGKYHSDVEIIECPCHGSEFNPKAGGAVVHGPAKRKLPEIGLSVDKDGKLVVAAQFDGRVGGDEMGVEDR